MKYAVLLLFFVSTLSCKNKTETQSKQTPENSLVSQSNSPYPEALSKILEAHGGLTNWNIYQTLCFTIKKGEESDEVHTIDLKTRRDHIDMGMVTMGFNGSEAWLQDPEGTYKGNPEFYHNLMFYFYAMPFVLADPGIIYEKTKALVVSDTSYPGLKISFEENTGSSANDEYYLYYDAETYQMRWLGYTATFGAAEKGTGINYINYSDWMPVQDLILPKSISWYAVEEGKPTVPRNTVNFTEPSLSPEARAETFYSKNNQIESDL
ncbi:MAG: DUF6503 family protein [Leeuwenhoekiella sp.]|nr:DUF6503 family protein [Leeuwenhoekiella sp.]